MEAKTMLQTVEGVYRNGNIELSEMPEGVSESLVIVTFLEARSISQTSQMIKRGLFSGEITTNEEDFQMAEFQSEEQGLKP